MDTRLWLKEANRCWTKCLLPVLTFWRRVNLLCSWFSGAVLTVWLHSIEWKIQEKLLIVNRKRCFESHACASPTWAPSLWQSRSPCLQNRTRFYCSNRPAIGPIQPPNQWVSGAPCPQIKRPGCELTTHTLLLSRLGMSGAIPQLLLHTFRASIGTTFIGHLQRTHAARNAPCRYICHSMPRQTKGIHK
jgi:hypothetical protein